MHKIEVQIGNSDAVYIAGDTVAGEVLLHVQDLVFGITRVTAALRCVEVIGSNGPHLHYEQATKIFEARAENETIFQGPGERKFPFSFTLGKEVNLCPPSCLRGATDGIKWYVEVSTVLSPECSDREELAISSSSPVGVYTLVSWSNRPCLSMKNPRSYIEGFQLSLFAPLNIPPAEETFNMLLSIKPIAPMRVHWLNIHVIKTIKYKFGGNEEKKLREILLSTTRNSGMKLRCDRSYYWGFPGQQLSRRECGAFTSLYMDVSYELIVTVVSRILYMANTCAAAWPVGICSSGSSRLFYNHDVDTVRKDALQAVNLGSNDET